jgi:hypothetical protein
MRRNGGKEGRGWIRKGKRRKRNRVEEGKVR